MTGISDHESLLPKPLRRVRRRIMAVGSTGETLLTLMATPWVAGAPTLHGTTRLSLLDRHVMKNGPAISLISSSVDQQAVSQLLGQTPVLTALRTGLISLNGAIRKSVVPVRAQ